MFPSGCCNRWRPSLTKTPLHKDIIRITNEDKAGSVGRPALKGSRRWATECAGGVIQAVIPLAANDIAGRVATGIRALMAATRFDLSAGSSCPSTYTASRTGLGT